MARCDSDSSKKIELTQLEKSILHLPTGTIKVSSLSQTDHKNLCLSANSESKYTTDTGNFLDQYKNMSQAGLSTARQIRTMEVHLLGDMLYGKKMNVGLGFLQKVF